MVFPVFRVFLVNEGTVTQHKLSRAKLLRLTKVDPGAQFEGDLGEILALGAEISPYFGLREKWESP